MFSLILSNIGITVAMMAMNIYKIVYYDWSFAKISVKNLMKMRKAIQQERTKRKFLMIKH